jgi:hypothetical protein
LRRDRGVDWLALRTAGQAIASGHADRLYDLEWFKVQQLPITSRILPYLYPPAYAALFLPFAWLPIWLGRVLWLAISLACIGASIRTSLAWSELRPITAACLSIAYVPLAMALVLGQMSSLTLLVFTLVARDQWGRRTSFKTGLIAGIALFKPQLLIPLAVVWVVNRRWTALLGLATMGGVVAGAGWLISPEATRHYLTDAPALFGTVQSHVMGRGSGAVLISHVGWVWGALVAVVGAHLIACQLQNPGSRESHAVLWLTPLIATPYLGFYDLTLCLLPLSFLAPTLSGGWVLPTLVGLCWLTPFAWFAGVSNLPSIILLMIFAVCAVRALLDPGAIAARSTVS